MTHDPRFSFVDLKRRVTVTRLLAAYNLARDLRPHGDTLVGPCPLHGGNHPTAFRVQVSRSLWRCFTSCGGGDVVDLIRRIEVCSYAEAARHLRRLAAIHHVESVVLTEPTTAASFTPFRRHIPLDPHVPFLQLKRITPATALRFDAGVTHRSRLLRDAVAVRLHDIDGEPVGYCARRLIPEEIQTWGKWRFPRGMPKHRLLYNAHRAAPHRATAIVVVEDPWSVMRLHQAGVPGAVALLGTTATTRQIEWISQARHVLLAFDADPAGTTGAALLDTHLHQLQVPTTVHQLPLGLDPDDLSDDDLRMLTAAHLLSP